MLILWVDDDVGNLEFGKRALERAGFTVETFDNVDDAWNRIQVLHGQSVGLILDIMMPTGNLLRNAQTDGGLISGAQFLRMLDDNDLLAQVRVFIYTIVSDNESTRQLARELDVHYFTKRSHPGRKIVDLARQEFNGP